MCSDVPRHIACPFKTFLVDTNTVTPPACLDKAAHTWTHKPGLRERLVCTRGHSFTGSAWTMTGWALMPHVVDGKECDGTTQHPCLTIPYSY